jgi:hypothetical protein
MGGTAAGGRMSLVPVGKVARATRRVSSAGVRFPIGSSGCRQRAGDRWRRRYPPTFRMVTVHVRHTPWSKYVRTPSRLVRDSAMVKVIFTCGDPHWSRPPGSTWALTRRQPLTPPSGRSPQAHTTRADSASRLSTTRRLTTTPPHRPSQVPENAATAGGRSAAGGVIRTSGSSRPPISSSARARTQGGASGPGPSRSRG